MTEFSVELRRTIAAPPERVYRAFLDPELLFQWMCPASCAVAHAEVDERVGGHHRVEFLFPDGERHAFDSTIRELVENERIDLDFTFEAADPALRHPTRVTVTFSETADGQTDLHFVHTKLTKAPPFSEESVTTGWGGALAKLVAMFDQEAVR